jgi:hypothetical protein
VADEMRRIIETIRARDTDTWQTSALAAHLMRSGLMQSHMAGRFSPRSSLGGLCKVAKLAHRPLEKDPWPLT